MVCVQDEQLIKRPDNNGVRDEFLGRDTESNAQKILNESQ